VKVSTNQLQAPIESSAPNSKYLEIETDTNPSATTSSLSTTSSFTMSSASSDPQLIDTDSELQELDNLIDEIPEDPSQSSFELNDGLSEEERAERKDFHRQIIDASRSGDEAALAQLAANLPASLQAEANAHGDTPEEFIQKVIERFENRPPPTALQLEMREFFKSQGGEPGDQERQDFFRELLKVSKSDEDTSGLVDSTPQLLKDFAASKGIEISELLGQIEVDMVEKFSVSQ